MPNYWVIAPQNYTRPGRWEKVWRYDLEHGVISVGWHRLGDLSSLSEAQLREQVDSAYKDKPPQKRTYLARTLWDFYHTIKAGDVVIARAGRKKIAGIGTVIREAYYEHNKNAEVAPDDPHSNYLGVQWTEQCRGKTFPTLVFPMFTLCRIDEDKFQKLIQTDTGDGHKPTPDVEDPVEFFMEKYLEEFIVDNFNAIFKGKLRLYSDGDEGVVGQQYDTDEVGTIDILAEDTASNELVVFELKKGRTSDKVIGQLLGYMGWVSKNLCKPGQDVRGVIICKEPHARLSHGVQMLKNVEIRYYAVDFNLRDQP